MADMEGWLEVQTSTQTVGVLPTVNSHPGLVSSGSIWLDLA
jgi:hypothetical protein